MISFYFNSTSFHDYLQNNKLTYEVLIDTYGVKIYTDCTGLYNIIKVTFFCDEMVTKFILEHSELGKYKIPKNRKLNMAVELSLKEVSVYTFGK